MPVQLEVCAASISSAYNAEQGGAARIELCSSLESGGITPSYGLIKAVKESVDLPVHVLIRPRAGDFVYSPQELAVIQADTETVGRLGCAGVVIGILSRDLRVDVAAMSPIVALAKQYGMNVTFHRAFDDIAASHRRKAIDEIIGMGCERILTSGGSSSVSSPEGRRVIAEMIAYAGDRIIIMAGGGISSDLESFIADTGAREIHASCKRVSSRGHNDGDGQESLFSAETWETDKNLIKTMVDRLDSLD
jgi:copper homeostasis protein